MKKFNPHFEILPPEQKAIWQNLASLKDLGFVLYGGTAIALHLGHRVSIDFDFFNHNSLNKEALLNLPYFAKAKVLQEASDSLVMLVKNVKISFFGSLKIGRKDMPLLTNDNVLIVASLNDLMATKLKSILQRSEIKDYKDIIAMIKAEVSLELGLSIAEKMFKNYSVNESIKALNYFDDGDLYLLTDDDKQTLIKATKNIWSLPKINKLDKNLC